MSIRSNQSTPDFEHERRQHYGELFREWAGEFGLEDAAWFAEIRPAIWLAAFSSSASVDPILALPPYRPTPPLDPLGVIELLDSRQLSLTSSTLPRNRDASRAP